MELDLWAELQQKSAQLNTSVKTLRNSGSEYAAAERDYKVLLRTECLKLKDDGVAIGLIDKTCYGIPSVAEARFKRDVAEAVYRRTWKPSTALNCKSGSLITKSAENGDRLGGVTVEKRMGRRA